MPDRELVTKIIIAVSVKLVVLALIWSFFFSNSRAIVSPGAVARHFETQNQ